MKEIIKNEPPEIYESLEIDRSFEDGIGLRAAVDATYIEKSCGARYPSLL